MPHATRFAAVMLVMPLLAAQPAGAQVRGACADGSLWWAEGRVAALGPCEAPEAGFFVLACEGGAVLADAPFPFGAQAGERVATTLIVDDQTFAIEGEGTFFPGTEVVGLGRAPLPADALAALRAGRAAILATEAGPVELHLSGSGAAIAAMLDACG